MSWKTRCPECNIDGVLCVVSGEFTAIGMTLLRDGFAWDDANWIGTEDETVKCEECDAIFGLSELWYDEGNWPNLWLNIAYERGVQGDRTGGVTGAEFARVGIAIINGCPICGATVGPHNSYQLSPDNPFAYCGPCAGVEEQ